MSAGKGVRHADRQEILRGTLLGAGVRTVSRSLPVGDVTRNGAFRRPGRTAIVTDQRNLVHLIR